MLPKKRDLSKLSKKEKIDLLEMLQEKTQRQRKQRPPYSPHSGQLKVHKSKALERYLLAGNGWGKDAALSNEIHWAATGYNPITGEHTPLPAKICLVLDTADKINDFLTEYRRWNELPEEWCSKAGKPEVSFIEYDTGSTVKVITHEVSPMKLEGSQWTHIFANEPMPRHVYVAIARGGRIKGRPARFLLCGTPIAEAWLRTDVYEPWVRGELPHVECFSGTTFDNEQNLADGYIERFSKKLTEAEKRTRLYGEFFDLEGQALAHLWKDEKHVLESESFEWNAENPCVIAIDPHPSKAHVAVILGVDKYDRYYVLDEFQNKLLCRQFCQALVKRGWFSKYRVVDIVVDSLGSGDSTSGEGFRSFIEVFNEELSRNGVGRSRATTYDEKSEEDFIERIRDVLAIPDTPDNFGQCVPRLRVLSPCKLVISDIRNVQWQRDKKAQENKPKLDTRHRDGLSCVKYALATNLYFKKTKAKLYTLKKPAYGIPTRSQTTPKRVARFFGRGRRAG